MNDKVGFESEVARSLSAMERKLQMFIRGSRDKEEAEKFYLKNCHDALALLAKEEVQLAESFLAQYKLGAETEEILNRLYKSVLWDYQYQENSKKPEINRYFTSHDIYYSESELEAMGVGIQRFKGEYEALKAYFATDGIAKLKKLWRELNLAFEREISKQEIRIYLPVDEEFKFGPILKEHTWYASDGTITKHVKYNVKVNQFVLEKLEKVTSYQSLIGLCKIYIESTPEVVFEYENEPIVFKFNVVLNQQEVPSFKKVKTQIVRYFAAKKFHEDHPIIIDSKSDGTSTVRVINDKISHEKARTVLSEISDEARRIKWKGNLNLLAALLFSLHESGLIEGKREHILVAFTQIFPEFSPKSLRSGFSDFVKAKDNKAISRFDDFQEVVRDAFHKLHMENRKNQ